MENNNQNIPILLPYDPVEFWEKIRRIVHEEVTKINTHPNKMDTQTPGMVQKPLYKITEVCNLFSVTRPTIYDWIKHGKLKPYKVRSRLYFLANEIQEMLSASKTCSISG
jgi:excisionase family DNA binding protein